MSATVEPDTDHSDDGETGSGSGTEPRRGAPYRRKGDPSGPVSVRAHTAEESSSKSSSSKGPKTGKQARSWAGRDRRGATGGTTGTSDRPRKIVADDRSRGESTNTAAPTGGRRSGRGRARKGGVAPWVPPEGRLGRRLRAREWSRRGFVPVSPGRRKLRHRILPRTVIGIAFMLMSAGIGAAFAGAAFYAYYDDRLAENERTVARFVDGFDQQFSDAAGALDDMRVEAVGTIRDELEPLGDYVADANGVVGLPATAGPSVWLVESRDENGAVVVGSGFAIVGHRGGTALVTSHQLIRAATVTPGPDIDLVKGDRRIPAELWSWDEERDLALLVVDEALPTLSLAGDQAQVAAVGRRVFALSGFGGQGASAAPGILIDHSTLGLQHTVPIGTLFEGGPLLDGEGRVIGISSLRYGPLGIHPGAVSQAPDVAGLCAELLRCSEVDETVTPEVVGG